MNGLGEIKKTCYLLLNDGSFFEGLHFGADEVGKHAEIGWYPRVLIFIFILLFPELFKCQNCVLIYLNYVL